MVALRDELGLELLPDAELESEFGEFDDLDALRQRRREREDRRFPEPSEEDIRQISERLRLEFQGKRDEIAETRVHRYQKDEIPEKWAERFQASYHFYSRLTHNEIMRVTASATRNAPKVLIAPAGTSGAAARRAERRQRWSNEFLHHLDRKSVLPIWRRFVDGLVESGLGAFHVYLTGEYDDIDFGRRLYETDRQYDQRMEGVLTQVGDPVGVRYLDPLSVAWEEDEAGVVYAVVTERKQYRHVYSWMLEHFSDEELAERRIPKPTDQGWPSRFNSVSVSDDDHQNEVETVTYYDRRWFAYQVGGEMIDVREHGLPGVPVIPTGGLVTSSPSRKEQLQGVTWGMMGFEQAINILLTSYIDSTLTFSRPKPIIETDPKAQLMRDPRSNQPSVLDLSGDGVRQLNPGQHLVDAFKDFRPNLAIDLLAYIGDFWQRSGMNPIAAGQSPGADPAGYTVNTLIGAANALYEGILDNAAMCWGKTLDFVMRTLRDTVKEDAYLTVPKEGVGSATEWLRLRWREIDDVPAEVVIDPLSDANRMALAEYLIRGMHEGIISRRAVQLRGYNIDDPEAEDEEIIRDFAFKRMASGIADAALQHVAVSLGLTPQGGPEGTGGGAPPAVDDQGNPKAMQQVGAAPAQSNPPSVGRTVSARNRAGQQPTSRQGMPPGV